MVRFTVFSFGVTFVVTLIHLIRWLNIQYEHIVCDSLFPSPEGPGKTRAMRKISVPVIFKTVE